MSLHDCPLHVQGVTKRKEGAHSPRDLHMLLSLMCNFSLMSVCVTYAVNLFSLPKGSSPKKIEPHINAFLSILA